MLLCELLSVKMCTCRQVTWEQATFQVWGCDDSQSLHILSRRIREKQVKFKQIWGRMTKEWGENS